MKYYRIKYEHKLFYDMVGYCKNDNVYNTISINVPELNKASFRFQKKDLKEISKKEYMKELFKIK